jgi:hypothetical protein
MFERMNARVPDQPKQAALCGLARFLRRSFFALTAWRCALTRQIALLLGLLVTGLKTDYFAHCAYTSTRSASPYVRCLDTPPAVPLAFSQGTGRTLGAK